MQYIQVTPKQTEDVLKSHCILTEATTAYLHYMYAIHKSF